MTQHLSERLSQPVEENQRRGTDRLAETAHELVDRVLASPRSLEIAGVIRCWNYPLL